MHQRGSPLPMPLYTHNWGESVFIFRIFFSFCDLDSECLFDEVGYRNSLIIFKNLHFVALYDIAKKNRFFFSQFYIYNMLVVIISSIVRWLTRMFKGMKYFIFSDLVNISIILFSKLFFNYEKRWSFSHRRLMVSSLFTKVKMFDKKNIFSIGSNLDFETNFDDDW